MKIKKKKLDQYQLIFDNNSKLTVYGNVIINNKLLNNKVIDHILLDKIHNENIECDCYHKALKYIRFRIRSIKEVTQYLQGKYFDQKLIMKVINQLIKERYLDDVAFIKAFIHDKMTINMWGPVKTFYTLKEKHGIKDTQLDEVLINSKLMTSNMLKIINNILKTNTRLSTKGVQHKIYTKLLALGYQKEDILEHIKDVKIDEAKIYQQEYQRWYNKLSLNYHGDELDKIIKEKLWRQGFNGN